MKLCSYNNCDRRFWAKGFCNIHLYRFNSGSDMDAPIVPRRKPSSGPCEANNCNRRRVGRGMCGVHYRRLCDGINMDGEIRKMNTNSTKACEWCKSVYKIRPCEIDKRKFCSYKCRGLYRASLKAIKEEYRKEASAKARVSKMHEATLLKKAIIKDDHALIPISNLPGEYGMIDIKNSWVEKYTWYSHKGYLNSVIEGKTVLMHRLLMSPRERQVVDHANHDTKDNRVANLRVCSQIENRRNSKKSKANSSGYKGVVLVGSKFVARLGYLGRKIHIGTFETAVDAAKAYNEEAKKLHGEFASLNIIKRRT